MTGLFSRAATVVRDAKANATPGPWTLVKRYSKKSNREQLVGVDLITPQRSSCVSLKYPHKLHDATWNTITNPAIGGPLADLLDLTERFVAEYPELVREHVDGQPCSDFACGLVNHIRGIARALLAEEATE